MDSQKKQQPKSNHKLIGILVILVTVTALILPATIAYVTSNKSDNSSVRQNNAAAQIQSNQAKCLNEAYDSYQSAWKTADKDGDGGVAYSDGATNIETAYYDNAISCYQAYRTVDSSEHVADFQAKRQQASDQQAAWLESMKQATYAPSSSDNYRSSMSCRSSAIGSSVYTTCD